MPGPVKTSSSLLLIIAELLLLLCSCTYVDESSSFSFDGGPLKEADLWAASASGAGAGAAVAEVQANHVVHLGEWRCHRHEFIERAGDEGHQQSAWHRKLGSRLLVLSCRRRPLITEELYMSEDDQYEYYGNMDIVAAGRARVCAFLRRHPAFFLHLAVAFLLFALLAALLYFILDKVL